VISIYISPLPRASIYYLSKEAWQNAQNVEAVAQKANKLVYGTVALVVQPQ